MLANAFQCSPISVVGIVVRPHHKEPWRCCIGVAARGRPAPPRLAAPRRPGRPIVADEPQSSPAAYGAFFRAIEGLEARMREDNERLEARLMGAVIEIRNEGRAADLEHAKEHESAALAAESDHAGSARSSATPRSPRHAATAPWACSGSSSSRSPDTGSRSRRCSRRPGSRGSRSGGTSTSK
jgi:hypothetical protein